MAAAVNCLLIEAIWNLVRGPQGEGVAPLVTPAA
jgi:hypothetical protein